VPLTLAPGEGVRIPLWEINSPSAWEQQSRWCVVSRTAFDAQTVQYVDPALGTKRVETVRRMRDPVLLANGIIGRG
jgi:hypothetical protein